MDNQTKIIFVLLAIIAILGCIFVLKVTGIIKPVEKNVSNKLENDKEEIVYNYEKNYNKDTSKMPTKIKINNYIEKHYKIISIIFDVLGIIIIIGIGKLYKKLGMPDWTVTYQYLYPFIIIATSYLPSLLQTILSVVFTVIEIYILSHLFESVGMSRYWPFGTIIIFLMAQFANVVSWFSNELNGDKMTGNALWPIMSISVIIVFLFAYIIANIRVADKLNKGMFFKIGMAILPFIFQPILGYMKEQ